MTLILCCGDVSTSSINIEEFSFIEFLKVDDTIGQDLFEKL